MSKDEKETLSIKPHGGKRPGAGRPLGSPNKLTRPLREAAAMHSEDCLLTLLYLRDNAEREQVRLAAATAILDRAHGKPRQDLNTNKSETIRVVIAPPPPVVNVRLRREMSATPLQPIEERKPLALPERTE